MRFLWFEFLVFGSFMRIFTFVSCITVFSVSLMPLSDDICWAATAAIMWDTDSMDRVRSWFWRCTERLRKRFVHCLLLRGSLWLCVQTRWAFFLIWKKTTKKGTIWHHRVFYYTCETLSYRATLLIQRYQLLVPMILISKTDEVGMYKNTECNASRCEWEDPNTDNLCHFNWRLLW